MPPAQPGLRRGGTADRASLRLRNRSVAVAALLAAGVAGAVQRIGAMFQPRRRGPGGGQQRRLVVACAATAATSAAAPAPPACPARIGGCAARAARRRRGGPDPSGRRASAPAPSGGHCRDTAAPPGGPGPGRGRQSSQSAGPIRVAGQGRAAFVADQARNEGRLAPAIAAKAEVGGHQRIAGQALRRVDRRDRPLHPHPRPLWSAAMTEAPQLTDRTALNAPPHPRAGLGRAGATFLHEEAVRRCAGKTGNG
jgi:hypothetical protein